MIAGKQDEVIKICQNALEKGATAKQILDNGLLAGMDVVGKRFKTGDMYIPEVLLCARCMHGAMVTRSIVDVSLTGQPGIEMKKVIHQP